MFELTNDHLREPQSPTTIDPTPLIVLMTPTLNKGEIYTLPGGKLVQGHRNLTSIEENAIHIINRQVSSFAPKSGKWLMNKFSNPHGMAYLAQRAHEKRYDLHNVEDLRGLSPLEEIPEHDNSLELHSYRSLLARVALMNFEERMDMNDNPSRSADEVFLRTYADYLVAK
jgi:hypothetical protein